MEFQPLLVSYVRMDRDQERQALAAQLPAHRPLAKECQHREPPHVQNLVLLQVISALRAAQLLPTD